MAERSRPRARGPRLVPWTAAYALATLVGLLTPVPWSVLPPAWPAAGVAVLWLGLTTSPGQEVLAATGSPGRRRWHRGVPVLGLVPATTLVAALALGWSPGTAVVLAVTTTVQSAAVVTLWWALPVGSSRDEWLGSVASLVRLGLAAVLASLLGFATTWLGEVVLHRDALGLVPGLVWWSANLAGLTLLVPAGLLVADRRATGPTPGTSRPTVRDWAVVTILSVLLLALVLLAAERVPVGFVLVLAVALAALRLGVVGLNVHVAVLGLIVLAVTLAGRGPFALAPDPPARVLLAHVFTVVSVGVALVLSLRGAERDRALAELAEARRTAQDRAALLTAVIENMAEGVAVVQADGVVLARNPVGRRLLDLDGPPSPVVLTAEDYDLHDLDGRLVTEEALPFNRVLAGEDRLLEQYVSFTQAGLRRLVEVRGRLIPGRHEEDLPKAVVSFRDVTAERADRDNLAAFAGVVAHDLINPLAVVRGWADLLDQQLRDGPVTPEEGRPVVRLISDAAVGMMDLVDDLLSYTVSRDAELRPEDLDLTALVEAEAVLHREGAAHAEVVVQPGMRVRADRTLVRQLLANLLANAVKYVAPGVVPRLEVGATARGDRVEVEVRDNGIGVPAEARERIFDNFQRAHTGQGYQGTGLGLAICRQVVERHDGTLTCEPHEGGGTVFRFSLPSARPADPGSAAGPDARDGRDGLDGLAPQVADRIPSPRADAGQVRGHQDA